MFVGFEVSTNSKQKMFGGLGRERMCWCSEHIAWYGKHFALFLARRPVIRDRRSFFRFLCSLNEFLRKSDRPSLTLTETEDRRFRPNRPPSHYWKDDSFHIVFGVSSQSRNGDYKQVGQDTTTTKKNSSFVFSRKWRVCSVSSWWRRWRLRRWSRTALVPPLLPQHHQRRVWIVLHWTMICSFPSSGGAISICGVIRSGMNNNTVSWRVPVLVHKVIYISIMRNNCAIGRKTSSARHRARTTQFRVSFPTCFARTYSIDKIVEPHQIVPLVTSNRTKFIVKLIDVVFVVSVVHEVRWKTDRSIFRNGVSMLFLETFQALWKTLWTKSNMSCFLKKKRGNMFLSTSNEPELFFPPMSKCFLRHASDKHIRVHWSCGWKHRHREFARNIWDTHFSSFRHRRNGIDWSPNWDGLWFWVVDDDHKSFRPYPSMMISISARGARIARKSKNRPSRSTETTVRVSRTCLSEDDCRLLIVRVISFPSTRTTTIFPSQSIYFVSNSHRDVAWFFHKENDQECSHQRHRGKEKVNVISCQMRN